jgi:hypothetical protein
MPRLLTTSGGPLYFVDALVGDRLYYTLHADGATRSGRVCEVVDLDGGARSRHAWPKPRCCRFVYVLVVDPPVPESEGPTTMRTVCECRLRRSP